MDVSVPLRDPSLARRSFACSEFEGRLRSSVAPNCTSCDVRRAGSRSHTVDTGSKVLSYLYYTTLPLVRDMTMLDPYNPRSVASQLATLVEHLDSLPRIVHFLGEGDGDVEFGHGKERVRGCLG